MANGSPTTVRVSGYLEKKSKLRIVSPWKKYWFVLEGRLLLYYRSKDEYEALSPCKGSINLCPPCNIKPVQSVSGVFQIECRANTIILRAEDRFQQERWMQALLAANAQFTNSKRMSHFRYSLDDLPTQTNKTLLRQNSMPYRAVATSRKDILERFQKIGAQTYRVSLGSITKFAKREQKSQTVDPTPTFIDTDIINEENSIDVNVENEHYDQTGSENTTLVENDQYEKSPETTVSNDEYCQVNNDEQFIRNTEKSEHLYERISKESKEEIVENALYVQEYTEYDVIDKIKEFEEIYEDPDCFKKKLNVPRPSLQSEDSFSQTSSSDDLRKKKSRFKMFGHFKKSNKSGCEPPKIKPKSASFLRKVWRKKTSSLDSEVTYQTVDYGLIEKQIQQDERDLQMLQELQETLQLRKNILQEKLNKNEQKSKSLPLLSKEQVIEQTSVESEIEDKPDLPPRQSQDKTLIDDKQFAVEADNEVKSIDEILSDLDKEKEMSESQTKVKDLIEKFNDCRSDDSVILRDKSKPKFICNYEDDRNSDGLSKLLEELSKVTSAPILSPGGTTSLITPVLTDDELLQLVPIRRRRLSDPDYDVPRPHRSLQLQELFKDGDADAIPATRFFGPILVAEKQRNTSIDPDSLEIQNSKTESTKSLPEEKYFSSSYVSHNYEETDNVLYAQPKSLFGNYATNTNCDINETINTNGTEEVEKKEESFIDSLEPVVVEQSTIF
ncbi:hypothetical protein RN001_014219 [Aquatica leii]|uniref:PH domain-containing protein n=1 Tax=Aquatica leii TaxID=1421715 RepID=A0AAN7SEF1_9COLE|nr:hypothetical protein RN001_014219 [Aquatica leii]